MTTLTVTIKNDKDLPVLQEMLNRLGLNYSVEEEIEYPFTKAELEGLVKTRQDFIDGKTTARNWNDIEDDLNRAYS